ncbi:basic salivary proline-rich protein 2-like [Hordeum vulgare subsp. vulgare]|uniref:basic salivary proline-rich protein 2-like n=1 Tax=Hordeum vulgare subsp. vulgare TaxID=112509 RepID=UPI001D1A59B8|nr:basic salivary proline-rich protein 2-like [Hordeum vulgare subsp. vulgare]
MELPRAASNQLRLLVGSWLDHEVALEHHPSVSLGRPPSSPPASSSMPLVGSPESSSLGCFSPPVFLSEFSLCLISLPEPGTGKRPWTPMPLEASSALPRPPAGNKQSSQPQELTASAAAGPPRSPQGPPRRSSTSRNNIASTQELDLSMCSCVGSSPRCREWNPQSRIY